MQRWQIVLLGCLAIFVIATRAIRCEEGTPFGLLAGTVKLEDGSAYYLAPVDLTIGGETTQIIANSDGTFGGIVPAGPVRATVNGVTVAKTVEPGGLCALNIVVKLPGVLLTVQMPDGTPATATINAAYQSPDGDGNSCPVTMVGAGRYWVSGVPSSATAFSVVAYGAYLLAPLTARREWAFEKPAERRLLSISFEHLIPLKVTLADPDAKPLPRVQVQVTLTDYVPLYDNWYPEGKKPDVEALAAGRKTAIDLGTLYADPAGVVTLGAWPTGRYSAKLTVGGEEQEPQAFTITAEKSSLDRFIVGERPRKVTQTVFDAQGHPVPNTELYASYCWLGKVTVLRNTSDATGKVVWKTLPPVRVIVWGKHVPAGVLLAETTTVTEPLPPPVPDTAKTIRFYLLNPGDQPVHYSWLLWKSNIVSDPDDSLEMDYYPLTDFQVRSGVRDSAYWECNMQGGAPFSMLVVSQTHPLWKTALSEVYAPYVDSDIPVIFDLVLNEGAYVKGRVTTPSGPPTALNSIRLTTVQESELPHTLSETLARQLGHQVVTLTGKGEFDASVLSPGTYRVEIDLYDRAAPTPAAMLLKVEQGENTAVIPLPDPVVNVPGGTTVFWAMRNAPMQIRRVTVDKEAKDVALFAPKEQLLALWYSPEIGKLQLYTPGDVKEPVRTLTLRAVTLQPRDEKGKMVTAALHLMPLLPLAVDQRVFYQLPNEGHAEQISTLLRHDGVYKANLWPGTYIVTDDAQEVVGLVVIPAQGPAEIPFVVGRDQGIFTAQPTKNLILKFATADQSAQRRNGAAVISVSYDVTATGQTTIRPEDIVNGMVTLDAPASASKMSLQWLDAGVIDGVVLPNAGTATPVAVPAWQPGATIAGTIKSTEKDPLANIELSIGRRGSLSPENIHVQTDDDGHFSVTGALPGTYFVFQTLEGTTLGWVLSVPAKGIQNAQLHTLESPVCLTLPTDFSEEQHLWWLPEKGAPLPLPNCGQRGGNLTTGSDSWKQTNSYDLTQGDGWLWVADARYGRSRYLRVNAQPNVNQLVKGEDGPSLGLYVPYAPTTGLPGAVTLSGTGDRLGLEVTFPHFFWQPIPLLNLTLGQIDAVPPGTYRLTVVLRTGSVTVPVTVGAYGAAITLPVAGTSGK